MLHSISIKKTRKSIGFIICFLFLQNLRSQGVPDTTVINQLIDHATELRKRHLDSALLIAKKAYTESNKLTANKVKTQFVSKSCNILGMILVGKGITDSATFYFNLGLKNNLQLNDSKAISRSYNNLGNVNYYAGNFKEALNFYLQSLKISEKIKDKKSIARTSDNIGNVYLKLNFPDKALQNHKIALETYSSINDSDGCATSLINIGLAYQKMGKSDSNLVYQEKALKIYLALNNPVFIAKCYNNIALAYDEMDKIGSALEFYKKSLSMSEVTGNENAIGLASYNIGNLYIQFKDYHHALQYLNRSAKIFTATGNKELLKETYKKMADAAYKVNDFKTAFNCQSLYVIIKDSVLNEETAKAIAELQTKYDTEKKENQLKLQAIEINEQRAKSLNTKIIFISIIVIMILIVLIITLRVRHKNKIKAELEKIENENLRKKAEADAKESERTRMAAELHDNVGSAISFISVKIDWLLKDQQLGESNKTELLSLKDSAQEVMGGLRETLWTLNSKSISNIDFCDKLKVYIKKHLMCEYTLAENLMEEYIIPNEDVLALYRCCQEIINNINKHSKATRVSIMFSSDNEHKLMVVIEDNGIGFKESEKEESYGLRNIKARMLKIKAEVAINSIINNGTRIEIKYR